MEPGDKVFKATELIHFLQLALVYLEITVKEISKIDFEQDISFWNLQAFLKDFAVSEGLPRTHTRVCNCLHILEASFESYFHPVQFLRGD